MGGMFKPITRAALFQKAFKAIGGSDAGSAAPAESASAKEEAPAADKKTTAKTGRRRARRTGNTRLLMNSNESEGSNKKTKMGGGS